MKRIFTLILTLGFSLAFATEGKVGFILSPGGRELTPIVARSISQLNRPFGMKNPMEVQAFLGLPVGGRPAIGGFAATVRYSLAKELSLDFGPALLIENKTPKSISIFVGASWRF